MERKKISKRGTSHIEWAISMGMFSMYVVALFVFLRPGATVETRPEGLLTMIEKSIKDEVVVDVKETPLYVNKCYAASIESTGGTSVEPSKIYIKMNDKFKIIDVYDNVNTKYSQYTGGNSFTIECTPENENSFITDKTFNIVYVLNTKPTAYDNYKPELEQTCTPNQIDCVAQLGATENKKYIKLDWLKDLGAEGTEEPEAYKTLKEKWGIPIQRDFIIYYSQDGGAEQRLIGTANPKPEQGNVYIIELKDIGIENDNVKKPVSVRVELW